MSSASTDVRKTCRRCLRYIKTYITCFKCDAAYHIYCWKKVPGMYVNQAGKLFCCGLTSNIAGTRGNPPKRMIEKGKLDGYNKVSLSLPRKSDKRDLKNCLHKEEDLAWNEFRCSACLLEFTSKEHLKSHYNECSNERRESIRELKEDKDSENHLLKEEKFEPCELKCNTCCLKFTNKQQLENHCSACPSKQDKDKAALVCSSRDGESSQQESYGQLLKQRNIESRYSRLNKDNGSCVTNMKRNLTHSNDKQKKYKCTNCKYSTYKRACMVKHKYIHTNERPFKCDTCEYATNWKWALNVHILRKHSNAEKQYKCTDCEYSTYTNSKLLEHKRTHTNEKPFKCDMCDYAAAWKTHLKTHVLIKHSNAEKQYKCGDCDYSTHIKGNLLVHKRSHTNETPYKCDTCDYTTVYSYHLNSHILRKHSNPEKQHKCSDCEHSGYTKHHLLVHNCTHINKKSFKCDRCEYETTYNWALKRHVLLKHSNAEKQYKCGDCEYSTHIKGNLLVHKSTHTKERPYKCDTCDYSTVYSFNLNSHILRKHSNAEKQYKCKDCDYSSYTKNELLVHTRTHANEKAFKCNRCDFATTHKGSLKKHVLVKHSNAEKIYKCEDCEYSTHRKEHLVRHKGTHTKERPYKCHTCGYAAANKSHLKSHILRKHSNAEKMYKCRDCEYSTHRKETLLRHEHTHTNK